MRLLFFIAWAAIMLCEGAYAETPKIGVMLGNKDMVMGDPSSAEKLCILQALEEQSGVDFQIYENQRSRRGSVDAARKMVQDGVGLALLPLISDEAIAAVPILQEAGIPYLTSATSESVVSSPEYGLSLFPKNQYQAETLAKLYFERYSERPVAVVIDESSAYSKQLSSQFIAQMHIINAGADIRTFNTVGDSFTELPDLTGYVVFAALFNPKIGLLYRQLREDGDIVLMGGDSIGVRKEFLGIVGISNESNGVELVFLKNWDETLRGEGVEEFRSLFHNGCSSQQKPTFVNAYVYDMGQLAVEWVLSKSELPPLSIIQGTSRTSILDGGTFEFSEHGYRLRDFFVFQYQGGTNAIPLQ